MSPLTPRELRIIADHVERLTKARVVNTQLDVATTPDLLSVDFPNGYTGTLIWMLGVHVDDPKMRQRVARHARHRDCYQLDVATIRTTGTPQVPQVTRVHVDVRSGAEEIRRIVRDTARQPGTGQNRA
ncbi:hypothetical protein [Streptomyces sp. NPDC047939]|uniref:hypothetical protein n=1 Tax=Streptomyces sp. NPDC047939 TaxID=3155381 RepID=UPI003414D29E